MIERLRSVVEADPRIAYAILFGSHARGGEHDGSDTDLGIGLTSGSGLAPTEIGDLVSRLEAAAGGCVDLVLLDEARPGLAYRVFRYGQVIHERDHRALVARKVRAILEYLDFRPIEEALARGALERPGLVDESIVDPSPDRRSPRCYFPRAAVASASSASYRARVLTGRAWLVTSRCMTSAPSPPV